MDIEGTIFKRMFRGLSVVSHPVHSTPLTRIEHIIGINRDTQDVLYRYEELTEGQAAATIHGKDGQGTWSGRSAESRKRVKLEPRHNPQRNKWAMLKSAANIAAGLIAGFAKATLG